jgi:aminopeptidase N
MFTITLLLFSQFFSEEIEHKQVCHPMSARAESLHSYDVLHYCIDIDLPMTSRYIEGAITMSARSNENNLTMIDMHLLGLGVDSIKVDGVIATYTHNYETLYVNLPQTYNLNDSFDVMVGYSGTASNSIGYLFYNSTKPISYTLGCPFCTRCWMPCYDWMWDKADHGVEFFVTVPDSFYVCATGAFLGADTVAGYATFHWKHDYPIAPYLIHFASSIYMTYSDWYHPTTSDSIEIKYFFWPQDSIYAPTSFQYTTDILAFYDSLYGPYPFERYGMDIVHPFFYAGMEHQTMATIYRQGFIGHDYYLMAHETAHMWWGDMVTCFGWANVWLNEGFATYTDCLYRERREGHQAFINAMISRRNAYFSSEISYPRPIYDPPPDSIFDWGHSYCKASWVLHMIRYLCGDDATWLSLMAAYRDSFEYKNASTDDMNMIMNQKLGGNYGWFFDEWVYNLYYPIYDIVWVKAYEAPNWRLILDIDQTQTLGPPVFHMPLPIGVDYPSGDTILTIAITTAPQHAEYVLPFEPTSITVDPQVWIIQKNTVTQGVQEYVAQKVRIECINSIGRAIDVQLSGSGHIKVYDITGRLVHEHVGKTMNFSPSSAGVYHVMVEDRVQRVVVIK